MQGAALVGVRAIPVDVEVAVTKGLPGFQIVGMVDAAVQEAKERVRVALKSSGFEMPGDRVLVSLAPSALKKTGSGYDLAIAAGILVATGQIAAAAGRDLSGHHNEHIQFRMALLGFICRADPGASAADHATIRRWPCSI